RINVLFAPAKTERGLSLSQRVDGRQAWGETTRHGVDSWRRADARVGSDAILRWNRAGEKRGRAGDNQLPSGPARLPRAPRIDRGIAAAFIRQLWRAGSDRRPEMGAEEHRCLRRRPESRDHLRRVSGIVER